VLAKVRMKKLVVRLSFILNLLSDLLVEFVRQWFDFAFVVVLF
jgi:hypothetical protein